MTARVVWVDNMNNVEQVVLDDHRIDFGGPGDGYCYNHQSFKCLDHLTDDQVLALHNAKSEP